jgi:hypothetical protein
MEKDDPSSCSNTRTAGGVDRDSERVGADEMYADGAFLVDGFAYVPSPSPVADANQEQLRSTSGQQIHWCLLVHPTGGRTVSKTGERVFSIALDNPFYKWMEPLYRVWRSQLSLCRILMFDYPTMVAQFRTALMKTSIKNVVIYQTRHSGASQDRMENFRSLPDVQSRGSWKQFRSVTRYEKTARLSSAFGRHPDVIQRYCLNCERHVEGIVMHARDVPLSITTKSTLS